MALLQDFEIPGTGLVAPNAYHIIKSVKTDKRLAEILPPPDESTVSGLTEGDRGDEVYWRQGYVASISILVYVSKEARDNGAQAIGAFGDSPAEVEVNGLFVDSKSFQVQFMVDTESSDSLLTQAYNHLKSTEYYSGATEV